MITDEGGHMTRCTQSLRHRRYDERIQNPSPLRSPNPIALLGRFLKASSHAALAAAALFRIQRKLVTTTPESRHDHHHLTFLVRVAPTLARPPAVQEFSKTFPSSPSLALPPLARPSDKQPGVSDRSKKPSAIRPRAMVLRKPVRKKPKDPGAVPAGGPGSRGGAGAGVAPAPPPNYMRATTCSGAKSSAVSAPQPGRAKAVLTAAAPRAGRATCSSAMKGPGAAHASCPYAYCSFKGHAHAAAPVPPLGAFVAARRRLIKTQQSMKLKGASPFRKPRTGTADEVGRTEHVVFGRLGCCGGDDAEDSPEFSGAASVDGSCASSDVISAGSVEPSGTTKHRGREEKKTLVDHGGDDLGDCRSDISEELDAKHGGNVREAGVGDAPKESSVESISSSLIGISFEDVSSACAYAASSEKKNGSSIASRRTSEKGVKQMRPFKPRPPNFLPAETGPEAEKVDLKHQAVGDPRAAEEWMLDYALRKEVKKLARAQKRKVEMLVQAFESVLPTLANEKKPEQHDNGDKRAFTLAWPSQACS